MSGVLTVPKPTLTFDDAGGGAAALEKPVTVLIGPVGTVGHAASPAALAGFGFLVQRWAARGAQPQVWDDGVHAWTADLPTAQPKPMALAYQVGAPNPWQGVLVAAGKTDGAGAHAFTKATGGYPVYSVRATFTGTDGASGTSPQSTSITFVGVADRNLLVLGPGEDEQLDTATQARLLLKNTGLQEIGGLTITRDSPGATVRLANAAGAGVVLRADGSIELRPAPGTGVVITGDVQTERIRYLPAGGGPKKDLN